MPTTAIYVMVAVLVAPALVAAGILPLAAHLFVFYYAVMAFITLPVAVAVYIAAPIAGASVTATGKEAFRLGIVGFIVPFIFVYSPALILQGSLEMLVPNLVTAVGGTGLIAVGASGYMFNRIGWLRRILILIAGIFLVVPITALKGTGLLINAIGAILGISLLWPEWKHWMAQRRAKKAQPGMQQNIV